MADTFQCVLVTPERQVLDEAVSYASIPGWDGQVGLMHLRAPLLIKLGQGPMRIDTPAGQAKWFYVGGGFAQMKDDKLTVLTSESVPAEEVNVDTTQAALKEAEARIATADADVARKQREIARAKSLLEVASHRAG